MLFFSYIFLDGINKVCLFLICIPWKPHGNIYPWNVAFSIITSVICCPCSHFVDTSLNKATDQMSLEPAVSSVSKNSSYFLSVYNVPGAVLSILYALPHFVLMTAP